MRGGPHGTSVTPERRIGSPALVGPTVIAYAQINHSALIGVRVRYLYRQVSGMTGVPQALPISADEALVVDIGVAGCGYRRLANYRAPYI